MADSRNSTKDGELFALYLARLRAEEIDFEAREQFNSDFHKIVEQSYAKLNSDFELEQNEIVRLAKIEYSTSKNEQRIQILQSQQKIIEKAQEGTREKLKEYKSTGNYKDTLSKLILQGVQTISEKEIRLCVLREDVELAKQILNELKGKFSELEVNITIDQDNFLPDSAIGGCVLINEEQTLRVDNSFEGRIQLATEGSLPQISQVLHK